MIVYSHLLFCMDSTLETYMPRVKGFNRFWEFWISYEFWKVWSNYVLEFVNGVWNFWVGWSECDVPSHHHVCFTCAAKRDFAKCFTNGTLNFICCLFWKFQTKLIGHHVVKNRLACDYMHPSLKFMVISTMMLGELIVHTSS